MEEESNSGLTLHWDEDIAFESGWKEITADAVALKDQPNPKYWKHIK